MEKQKERYKSIFNVMEFGACADGSKDDTQAFQNALDAARTVEGKVVVPAGIYRLVQFKYMRAYHYTEMQHGAVQTVQEALGFYLTGRPMQSAVLTYQTHMVVLCMA